ncbi:hypothetical protein [Thalassomonas actiniarum]|uniref:hypothetical protein n=1 Tax=Thalassomonas actiniarum TaxID=485447 RepID=UPI00235DD47E|nr:hypothetical protein [Thalassomonas actiniarum]
MINLDWLTDNGVASTTVNNGIPELVVVSLFDNKVQQLNGNWAYGLTDSQHPEHSYLIEQQTHALYRASLLILDDGLIINVNKLTKT